MDQRTLNELADELQGVFEQLSVPGSVAPARTHDDTRGELEVMVDGHPYAVTVTARSDLRAPQAKELPEIHDAATDRQAPTPAGLVFADRLSENTRSILQARGWGWVDRKRGHVRLWAPGARIDALITPTAQVEAVRVRDPFSEKGIKLTLWLLLHPDEPASPRAISRQIDVSAGQISNLLGALKADALLRRDKTPLVPELFWALVDHWRPKRHALAAMPSQNELASAGEMHTRQWVLTDTRAAMRYGAPVAVSPDYPPDLYVPDQKSLTWLLNRSSLAPEFNQRIATVAVAPTSLVGEARFRRRDADEVWPLAHPVVVALDLAVDRNRGREVVDLWTPADELEVRRVW